MKTKSFTAAANDLDTIFPDFADNYVDQGKNMHLIELTTDADVGDICKLFRVSRVRCRY